MPFAKGQTPHNFKDLSGNKFNMLSVLSYAGKGTGIFYGIVSVNAEIKRRQHLTN